MSKNKINKANKKAMAKRDAKDSQTGPTNRLARILFRPWMLIGMAAAISLSVLRPMLVDSLPELRSRDEYRLRASDIQISEPPRWVPGDLVEQVVVRSGLPKEMSLLDENLLAKIAEAFRLHPWVAEVVEVRKTRPARLSVDLKYRRPVAMVEVQQGMYPIDAEGHLLPSADFSVADTKRYPLVRNVQSVPQGPAGTNWGDVVVIGAARLAVTLLPHWKAFELVAIHVPRQTTASTSLEVLQFELLTHGGSRISWGRAPGLDHPGELSTEQKIGRLQKYLADFSGFDQPHGPYQIDIRHWREISRYPISQIGRKAGNGQQNRRSRN